jgi:hypothetical protein
MSDLRKIKERKVNSTNRVCPPPTISKPEVEPVKVEVVDKSEKKKPQHKQGQKSEQKEENTFYK